MSGDRIVLAGDADGSAARLVHAAGRLADAALGPHALVGGLAVMCRLAAIHRVTQDIDAVTETTAPRAVEIIGSTIGKIDPSNPDRVLVDGVMVDIIDTQGFVYDDLLGIELADRLFVVSHRWALDTATHAEIVSGDASALIRVATPAALVATKTGALLGGRRRAPHKRASDLYDLFRLTVEFDRTGTIASELAAAPFDLGQTVGVALQSGILDNAERSVRWLLNGGPEMSGVTPDDLRDVLGPLSERLQA